MVARLSPRILSLQSQSRDPICVYINSRGGYPRYAESLLNLLNLSNQDMAEPCWIITVVTLHAGSAAADLLASGDYSIAFPESTILHHGVRRIDDTPSTLESTSQLSEVLRISNAMYAMKLGRKIEKRFTFRFFSVRNEFAALREKKNQPNLTDCECFTEIIREKLSPDAITVLDKAVNRNERYRKLINSVFEQKGNDLSKAESTLQVQAHILRAILDVEVADAGTTGMTDFRVGGLRRLVDDFYLLNEYLTGSTDWRLDQWCKQMGRLCLTDEQGEEIDALPDEQEREKRILAIGKPILKPMLSFFIALCHALQEGENELNATDAFWLGLVDEVVGDEDLWNLRLMYEFTPDPEEAEPNEETVPVPEKAEEVLQAAGAGAGTS
jgi:ATP-dependent protease ClpP protease subunit